MKKDGVLGNIRAEDPTNIALSESALVKIGSRLIDQAAEFGVRDRAARRTFNQSRLVSERGRSFQHKLRQRNLGNGYVGKRTL